MATNRDSFEKLTEEWEPKIRAEFLAAIEDISNRQNIDELSKYIAGGDVNGALSSIGLDPSAFEDMSDTIHGSFSKFGQATAPEIRSAAGSDNSKFWFSSDATLTEDWARQESSGLVNRILEDADRNVRDIIADGIADKRSQQSIALDIAGRIDRKTGNRIGGVIGLSKQQVKWQKSYSNLVRGGPDVLSRALGRKLRDKRFDAAIKRAIKAGEPLPYETQSKMIVAYRNNLLRHRGKVIARTEVGRARAWGRALAWQQSIDKGLIDESKITRFWFTRKDERVRYSHREIVKMNRDGVEWGEPFQTPSGPSMRAPHDHDPNCRCRERIVYKGRKYG